MWNNCSGCWCLDFEELYRCLTAQDTDVGLFCVFFFFNLRDFLYEHKLLIAIFISLWEYMHYYVILENKWSSKDGSYTLNIHVYKGILFIFNRTQNEPQLLLTKANFSKAEWLNYFSLFPPLCSLLLEQSWFGLGDLRWLRHRRRHLCLRGTSLLLFTATWEAWGGLFWGHWSRSRWIWPWRLHFPVP